MDDKLLQQIGHFIGQTRAEVLTLSDDRLEKAVELLREDITRRQDELLVQVGKVADQSFDEVNDKLHDLTTKHVEEIALLTEQLKAQEIFEAQLTERIASIKDGEKGDQGAQGNDGEDGLDRPILEPVELVAQKDYPKSTVGTFDGGLWIATKETVGSPQDDPQAWHCMLDAMTEMSIDLMEDRKFKLSVRMSSGHLIDDTFDIPYPEHKGIWEEGEYKKGDIVTKGSSMWLAQEDTSGQPPGNGWQQILSAPRGKQGPAGKSIVGPQGKPGRNGADAMLPDNFIEDVMALASERKAFEDGRSGSEAITSFRGYFTPDETYRSGDVVNDSGSLYLCTSGGMFSSIARGQDSWELMLNVPKLGAPPHMRWIYDGYTLGNTYLKNDTLREAGWTMIANKQTTDYPSPRPIGPSFPVYDGTLVPSTVSAKVVTYGTRYTWTTNGYILSYRVDITAGNRYEIYLVKDPLGIDERVPLAEFTALTTGWKEYSIEPIIVLAGTVFDLVVVTVEPDPAPTSVTLSYDYQTPQNPTAPVAGQISHSRGQPDLMQVSNTDQNGDQTATIEGLSAGDTINCAGLTYTVLANIPAVGYANLTVSPAATGLPIGIQDVTFNTTVPTDIPYGIETDYWLSSPYNGQGLYAVDAPYTDNPPNDNAYGADITIQDIDISEDWDVVAVSSDVGSGDSVEIRTENVLRTANYTDQLPTGLGAALQIVFGGPQTTDYFDVDAGGNITCLVSGEYQCALKMSIGRRNTQGIAQIYTRVLLNGAQIFDSSHIILSSDDFEIPSNHFGTLPLTVNDVLTVEIIRDTDGVDSGGAYAGVPEVAGWNSSPSALAVIDRIYAI
jgi:hypothetical protein